MPGINQKNQDIEILRAIAVLAVMVNHLHMLFPYSSEVHKLVAQNFQLSVGVDLFFVISGYVITRSIAGSLDVGVVSPKTLILSFWVKRIFRLLPAAWFWLAIIAAYTFFAGNPFGVRQEFSESIIPVVASFLNVMNFYSAYCVANQDDTLFCGIFYIHGHFWSLSLEEQFYLVFILSMLTFNWPGCNLISHSNWLHVYMCTTLTWQ